MVRHRRLLAIVALSYLVDVAIPVAALTFVISRAAIAKAAPEKGKGKAKAKARGKTKKGKKGAEGSDIGDESTPDTPVPVAPAPPAPPTEALPAEPSMPPPAAPLPPPALQSAAADGAQTKPAAPPPAAAPVVAETAKFVSAAPVPVASVPPPAAKTAKPRLIVMNLVAERGVDDGVVRLLNELLLTQFAKADRYEVIGGSDVQALISNEAQKQLMSGCTDSACLAELGGALGAEFLASSNLGKIGDFYLLNVKILNTRTGEVVKRWSEQVEGLENKLMLAVRKSVAAVASENGKPPAAFDTENATTGETITASGSASTGSTPGIVPIALWGAGGVGLVMGAIFGSKAKAAYNNATDPAYIGSQKVVDGGKSSQLLANVGFGLGFACLAAGTVVWLVFPNKPAPTVAFAPVVTSEGAAVSFGGAF